MLAMSTLVSWMCLAVWTISNLSIHPLSLPAHSVASGDPYDHSVLLWTRAEPTAEAPVDIPVCVTYKVYTGQDGTVSLHSIRVPKRSTPLTWFQSYLAGLRRCQRPRVHVIRCRFHRQGRSYRFERLDPILVPVRQLREARPSLTCRQDEDRPG